MLHNQFLHGIKNLIPGPFHFDGVRELFIVLPLYLLCPTCSGEVHLSKDGEGLICICNVSARYFFLSNYAPTLVEDPTNYCEPNLFHKCIRARSNVKLERPELPF